MEIEKITKYKDQRKWAQFSRMIVKNVNDNNSQQLCTMFLDNIHQIHPKTITETALAMTGSLKPESAIELLNTAKEAIHTSILYSGNFELEVVSLEIVKSLILVEQGELEGIEKNIYGWKNLMMNERMLTMYNFLAFKFYDKIHNLENAFKYLFEYVKLNPEANLMEVLTMYSLVSYEFFNFTSISTLPGFEAVKEESLLKIFTAVQAGDISFITPNQKTLTDIFQNKAEIITEKVHMIALVNLCFYEPKKQLSFEAIEESLQIDSAKCNYYLLKALGLGLIKGWIDGGKRTLYFDSIAPRALNNDQILQMKSQFHDWKLRVKTIIKCLNK